MSAAPQPAPAVRARRRTAWAPLAIVAGVVVAALVLARWVERDPDAGRGEAVAPPSIDDPALRERGRYLVVAGNCVGCHTVRGGTPFAGGRGIATPFGVVYGSNLTPDPATGLGRWSADDFWQALHLGRRPDGTPLYPAFPYPSYTKVRRADADAMYAYLRSLPPVHHPATPHALRFPYDQRALLHLWRALYFRPGTYRDDTARDAAWNRGAYLVQGLGHCGACHTRRNALGATDPRTDLAGALIPAIQWYAPPLHESGGDALGQWQAADLVAVMHTGVSARSAVAGPMAEVVARSLQFLSRDDVESIATYLTALPPAPAAVVPAGIARGDTERGARIYEDRCASCHGSAGEGRLPAYPPLAGNPSVTAPVALNAIRMVLHGGFAPSTAGNPRPYGMPPFAQALGDAEVAAVVSYVRSAWGNAASGTTSVEVAANRSVGVD